ncbi:MAG: DUF3365 domain-containing protein [Bacteroidales bacterium]|nr:DUF3365 domain-containing protein [Bacteroidales bacterium]
MNYFLTPLIIILSMSLWFGKADSTIQAEQQTEQQDNTIDYKKEGQEIIRNTFLALNNQLRQAMEEGGPEYAIRFCKIAALPITDSMSTQYSASIRRVSENYRNPNNAPQDEELAVLKVMEIADKTGVTTSEMIIFHDDHTDYYAPITVGPHCLKCHGVPLEDFDEEHARLISSLYPDDKATGYKQGDLRGIWHIRFNK